MAWFDHRAIEDYRFTDQSYSTWGYRIGCFPFGDSFIARLRVFREADYHRLGSCGYRIRMGRTHEASRVYKICGARRRLGAIIVDMMGVNAPPELIGIHTNMAGAVPSNVTKAIQTGGPMPSDLSAEERHAFERQNSFLLKVWLTDLRWETADRHYMECRFTNRPSGLDSRPRRA